MMPKRSSAALLALVPGIALGANLRQASTAVDRPKNDIIMHAVSAVPPTRQAGVSTRANRHSCQELMMMNA